MLAKFDVKEKKIGENIYYVRALPPFPALSLLGDIQAVLTTALKDTTHREGDSDVLSTTIDFGNFIANMGNNLNGEVLIKFSNRLLDSDYVSVKKKTSSGEYETIRLSEEVIDSIFTANIMELLELLYFVLEVNYGDFFALMPNLSGRLKRQANV